MQDELFMRQWNAHHDGITTGLKRAAGGRDTAGSPGKDLIGRTYDDPIEDEDPPVQIGTRMIAAGVATALLWVTVIGFASTMGIPFLA